MYAFLLSDNTENGGDNNEDEDEDDDDDEQWIVGITLLTQRVQIW